ncbi:hypothetical protein [Bordetella genomosp. 9]|nr:hypothetical protein [Bordetella genomosp. 9]
MARYKRRDRAVALKVRMTLGRRGAGFLFEDFPDGSFSAALSGIL